jgi:hypothetical protein
MTKQKNMSQKHGAFSGVTPIADLVLAQYSSR